MKTEHANAELFASLAEIQGEVENATKGSSNPHFKSKYADLAEILNKVRPVCAKHGVALIQSPSYDPERNIVTVTTVLGHKSGGMVSSEASCVPNKTDAQGVGAATTYLRRYALAAMTGIAQEDDDGNTAAHNKPQAPASASQIAKIKGELAEVGADVAEFEKFLGCKLDEITVPMLARANEAIERKRRANMANKKNWADRLQDLTVDEGGDK